MSRTVALSTLRSDVRFKADIGGATVRHTDAQLNRLINQSIQMFRERISDEGSRHYLVPYSSTLGIGPTSPYAFYQLDLSSGPSPALVRTYAIDVTIDGVVCTLDHVPFEARNDYGTIPGGSRPVAWCHFRTDQVGILPASSAAYPFTVWYLPKFTDISADGDTFDGVAGWEEWVVWDVVCQVIARDQFPQAYAIAEQRRAEVEQRVIRGATKVTQAGGAHVGRDSFGSKLPHFLGGSRKPQAVAGGPYVPAGGSVTDAMLVDMTGPTVKGVLSGTTRPYSIGIGTLTTYLSTFSAAQRGLVPPPVSAVGLFLKDDGTWAAPAGGGGGGSVGPSGAVQYQAGTGMAGASGFRIHGISGPSLIAHLDGTFRITGGELAVGSGTTRIQGTGIDAGNGSIVNVATLVAGDTSLRSLRLQSGLAHSQLQPVGSGMFLGNLSGTGTPSPVAVATMHAFAPTFTSTRPGTVPESGGGTSNFLRADGTWAAPPGGSASPGGDTGYVQYRDALGGFQGASGVRIVASGTALLLGGTGPTTGNVRLPNSFQFVAFNEAGNAANLIQVSNNVGSGAYVFGSNSVRQNLQRAEQLFRWELNGASGASMSLTETGLAMSQHSLSVGSLNVGSGLANSQLALMQTGTVKANLTGTGTPSDVAVATLHAFAPTFTAVNPGTVPESGGGTTNFLRADGTWAAPPGGSATPGGAEGNLQYNSAGSFEGFSGISIATTSNGGLAFGDVSVLNAASVVGSVRIATGFTKQARVPSGGRAILESWTPSNRTLQWGSNSAGTLVRDGIRTMSWDVATGGSFTWQAGGALRLASSPTGTEMVGPLTMSTGVANVQALTVASGIGNEFLDTVGSGMIHGRLTGTGTPQNVPFATFMAFAPTFTSARMGVVPASGGGTSNYLRADGSWAAPSGAAQYPPVGGVTNLEMAVMPTGTVKGNLAGNATPSDVSIATLFAFSPTFTATRTGDVPASGGGTTNYLRADGTWAAPPGTAGSPGGADTNIQYNAAGSFGGASGLNVAAPGALGIGVPSFLPGFGDIRVASGLNITANLPSGIGGVAARQQLFDWSGGGASGVLDVGGASGILGTLRNEVATGGSHEWLIGGQTGMALRPTGLDARQFHINAKSLSVGHINGLPFDFNGLKRGLDIGNSSGLPSGLNLYLPRGAGSGANRYIIPSGVNGTGTQAAPRFVTLNPTGGRGGGVIRIERVSDGGWPFEIRTPTGTVLHSFPSGAKGWADCMFEKPSGAVFQLAGHADMY